MTKMSYVEQKKKDLDRISHNFAKQSYYCPYCGCTNRVGAQHQRKLLQENKKLLCYSCHRGFSIEGMKTVYDIGLLRFYENQYKRFMKKKEESESNESKK